MGTNESVTGKINQKLLAKLNVLYIEDDESVSNQLQMVLKSLFKNVTVCVDGEEAFNVFKHNLSCHLANIHTHNNFDIIISDINMPKMDGIELLKAIRNIDANIPFIFTTSYTDVIYAMEAIKYGVSHYAVKPINVKELMLHVQEVCELKYKQRQIENTKIELERYVDIINQVAIISKTNPSGKITFVNDIFCEVAKYSREELIGKNQNIVRHKDMPSAVFKNMWEEIKTGKSWKGTVKNRAKDGEPYYVNATIFPIYDDLNENIVEYVGIRFLTTEEEADKREFKKKVMQTFQQSKRNDIIARTKINDLKDQVDNLTSQLKKYDNFDIIEENLSVERESNRKLKSQINHYEKEIQQIKEKSEQRNIEVKKIVDNSLLKHKSINVKYERIKVDFELLKQKSDTVENEIRDKGQIIAEQAREITKLKDGIRHSKYQRKHK